MFHMATRQKNNNQLCRPCDLKFLFHFRSCSLIARTFVSVVSVSFSFVSFIPCVLFLAPRSLFCVLSGEWLRPTICLQSLDMHTHGFAGYPTAVEDALSKYTILYQSIPPGISRTGIDPSDKHDQELLRSQVTRQHP